jgi:hypothetical protein
LPTGDSSCHSLSFFRFFLAWDAHCDLRPRCHSGLTPQGDFATVGCKRNSHEHQPKPGRTNWTPSVGVLVSSEVLIPFRYLRCSSFRSFRRPRMTARDPLLFPSHSMMQTYKHHHAGEGLPRIWITDKVLHRPELRQPTGI